MLAYLAVLPLAAGQFAQSSAGELRITVRDSAGLSVRCRVTVVSEANDVSPVGCGYRKHRTLCVD